MSAVKELVVQAAAFMERAGYSPGSRADYQRVWERFEQYCAQNDVPDPVRETAARFCAAADAEGPAQWQVFHRRTVDCLFDVAETGRYVLRAGRGKTSVPEVFATEFQAYCSWVAARALAAGTVRAYVTSLAPLAASTRAGHLYFLREYLRFAVAEHGADPVLGAMFPVIVTDQDAVLPSVYRPGEVAEALAEAGNSSETPLRDRAVMLLASLLGLRSSDIKGLRFEHIDWVNRRLSFLQCKTDRRLDLPLPDECVLAVIDYWKNERPEVDDRQVFLRHRAPLQPPGSSNHFHDVVAGCFDRAGVEVSGRHFGLHSLRHSAAVGMLEAGTPYPVIGAVLGHASANTTRRYLRVDVAHLRPLALEVPNGR